MKQVIVLRKDLNMRKGKMVAQGAHASMAAILGRTANQEPILLWNEEVKEWLSGPFTKICVSVNSEDELLAIHRKALEANVLSSLIRDSGKTEFDGVPTYTAVAVGPNKPEVIDAITGHLPLL